MPELKTRVATQADKNYASEIAKWTADSGTMLPKPADEVLDLFSKNNSVVVLDENGELVSHAAIAFTYPDGSVEVGCVVTNPNKRRGGAATEAVKQVLNLAEEKYPGKVVFALANEQSSSLFKKIGATKMRTTELSKEVWIPCKNCPRMPEQKPGNAFECCDTPYNLAGISR